MSRADFYHLFPIEVRWGDADAMGHINNVQYLRYLESGRVAYCETVMDLFLHAGMGAGWILADMQCSYLQQVNYPAKLEVGTRISQIGNKSVTILADIFRQGEPESVLSSKGVMVWFDYQQQTTESIPARVRQMVVEFEKLSD